MEEKAPEYLVQGFGDSNPRPFENICLCAAAESAAADSFIPLYP